MKRKHTKAFAASTLDKRRRGYQQHHNTAAGRCCGGFFTIVAQAYTAIATVRAALPAMKRKRAPAASVNDLIASINANKAAVKELIAAAIAGDCNADVARLPGFLPNQIDFAYEYTGNYPPFIYIENDIPLDGLLAAGTPLPARLRGAILHVCRKKQITSEDVACVRELYTQYTNNKERR